MTTQTVITIDHVRAVGLCVNGTRTGLRVTIWISAPSCAMAVMPTPCWPPAMQWPNVGRARPQSIQPAGARLMGGSSKKTVGYRYRMGLHLALCQGPSMPCRKSRWATVPRGECRPCAAVQRARADQPLDQQAHSVWRRRARRRRGRHHRCAGWSCRAGTQRLPDESPRQFHSGISGVLSWWHARSCSRPTTLHQTVGGARPALHGGLVRCAVDGMECRSPHLG